MVTTEGVPFELTEMLESVIPFVKLRIGVVVPMIVTSAPEYIAVVSNKRLVDDCSWIDPVLPA